MEDAVVVDDDDSGGTYVAVADAIIMDGVGLRGRRGRRRCC